MAMKRLLLTLVFVPFFYCSKNNNLEAVFKELGIPIFMRIHLPQNVDPKEYSLTYNLVPVNNIATTEYIYFYFKMDNIWPPEIEDSIANRAIYTTRFSDSCNIIPLFYQNNDSYYNQEGKEWLYDTWKKNISRCEGTVFPIPSFIGVSCDDYKLKHEKGLSDDFRIYVLDSKQGKTFEEKYYTTADYQMPSGWENGFTRGVAISNKSIIFFFTSW